MVDGKELGSGEREDAIGEGIFVVAFGGLG